MNWKSKILTNAQSLGKSRINKEWIERLRGRGASQPAPQVSTKNELKDTFVTLVLYINSLCCINKEWIESSSLSSFDVKRFMQKYAKAYQQRMNWKLNVGYVGVGCVYLVYQQRMNWKFKLNTNLTFAYSSYQQRMNWKMHSCSSACWTVGHVSTKNELKELLLLVCVLR